MHPPLGAVNHLLTHSVLWVSNHAMSSKRKGKAAKCRPRVARGARPTFLPGFYRTTGADLANLLRSFFGASYHGPHLFWRVWRATRRALCLPETRGAIGKKEKVFLPLEGLHDMVQKELLSV